MLDVKAATRSAAFGTFAVPALLTPPGLLSKPVEIIGPDRSLIEVPAGAAFVMTDRQTFIALRRDQAPEVPRGTTIEVAGQVWTVDGIARDDGDVVTVIVR